MRRYHKEIFFEDGAVEEIKKIISKLELQVTKHFMQSWIKRGNVCIPTKSIIERGDIFEYSRDELGKICRFAVRCSIAKDYDVIFVLNVRGDIITSWSNAKDELHENMRKDLYVSGTEGNFLSSERTNFAQGNKKSRRCEAFIREWRRKKYRTSRKTGWNWA